MMNLIEKLIICAFETMMFYDYQRNMLSLRNNSKYKNFILYVVTGILWFAVNLPNNPTVNLFGIPVILISFSILLYEDAIKKILSNILIFWLIMTGMEFLPGWVYLSFLKENASIRDDFPAGEFVFIIVVKILTFFVLRVAKMYFSRNEGNSTGNNLKYVLILPITTFIVYSGLFGIKIKMDYDTGLLFAGCVLLLFSNIVVFYVLEKLETVTEKNKLYEIEKVQYELNKQHYDRLDEISLSTSKYVHNLKEHLTTIGRLASENRNDEILNILGDMEAGIDIIVNKNYTDNRLLNAILCEKEQLAVKAGISVGISVEPHLELDFIKSGDMIAMVGNLLQNAIEAAGKGKDGYINVSVNGSQDRFIVIIVENNYFDKIESHDGKYLSAKRGYRECGLGIRCVEETAHKYGGILYLHDADGVFKAILTISKEYVKKG